MLVFVMVSPAGSWPVHDTGQTQCFIYDENTETWNEGTCPASGELFYGQDGNYLVNAPSFTKLDAQGNDLPDSATSWTMVRDNITGLIWEVKQDKDGLKNYLNANDADNTYFWYDSNPETNGGHAGTEKPFGRDTEDFINTLNDNSFGGHSDWRLPNLKELQTIVHYGRHDTAAFDAYFPDTASWSYWSSTTYAGDASVAWLIFFRDGILTNYYKSGTYYVRAVRGEQSGSFDNLVIDGHGTVTDTNTGLMWQTEDDGVERSWGEALDYAENLTLADYGDWRLPTIKELLSIVDYNSATPSIDPVFSNTVSSYYWSSTTNVYDGNYAWRANFHDGLANSFKKSDKHYVRAVRAGQNRLSGHLFILSPAQGSTWNRNDVMPITWDPAGIIGNVNIAISLDGGKTYTSIVEDVPNNGRHDWTVPGSGSVNCMIKIVPLEDESKKTVQGLFSIQSIFGLYYTAGPNGSITGETMQIVYPYADGTAVEAVPDPGYSFIQWSDGSTENPRTDTNVTANITVTATFHRPGDINADDEINLYDAIFVLQVVAGMPVSNKVHRSADVNGDKRIGLAEACYTLQELSAGENQQEGFLRSPASYETDPVYSTSDMEAMIDGFSEFTLDFYHALRNAPANQGKNLFFSAYSIENALAMTWAGARGETAAQMSDTLRLNLPQDRFHPTLNALNIDLNSRDDQPPPSGDPFSLNVVNALWSRIGYPFLPSYLEVIATNYDAGVRVLDFVNNWEGSRETINQWVEDQTNEKIKDLLPQGSITPDTAVVLTNAIYFKGSWYKKFEEESTAPGSFYRLDGTTVTADMMHSRLDTKYAQGVGFDAVELPYASPMFEEHEYPQELSMLLIIPDEGAFETVEGLMDKDQIDAVVSSLHHETVDLTLPKFEFECEVGCKTLLRGMGMLDAFEPLVADFGNMVNPEFSMPWIDEVYHKAFVAVDETGTEAAAATAVVMTDTSVPEVVTVSANKPFIFLIRDQVTGSILFMGRVLDPTL
ncbi:MAG: serpin family protein [Desulfatiglandaceae bacterium]